MPEPTWTVTRPQLARAIAMAGVHRSENSAADQILAQLPEPEPGPLKIPDDMILAHRGDILTLTGIASAWMPDPGPEHSAESLADWAEASGRLRAAAGEAVTP